MLDAYRTRVLLGQLARHGDMEAYKQIFLQFYPQLLRFATGFVKSREMAEEVVSDVFIKIWENRKNADGIENLQVYLYTATKNTCLNYLSRQKRIQALSLDGANIDIPSHHGNPEDMMITAEMSNRITRAVLALPPKCRMIFKLIKEDRLKYKDVADILNISVKTVENQLTIALRKISSAMQFNFRSGVSSSSKK